MGCIIARHVAAAVTARGRTTAEEHKALNARITLHPTDVLLSFNALSLSLSLFSSCFISLSVLLTALSSGVRVSIAGSLVEKS